MSDSINSKEFLGFHVSPKKGDVWWVADVLVVVVKESGETYKESKVACCVLFDLDDVFMPCDLVHFDELDFNERTTDQFYWNDLEEKTRRLLP